MSPKVSEHYQWRGLLASETRAFRTVFLILSVVYCARMGCSFWAHMISLLDGSIPLEVNMNFWNTRLSRTIAVSSMRVRLVFVGLRVGLDTVDVFNGGWRLAATSGRDDVELGRSLSSSPSESSQSGITENKYIPMFATVWNSNKICV